MIPRGISYPDIDNGVLHHHPKVDKEFISSGQSPGGVFKPAAFPWEARIPQNIAKSLLLKTV
jgi:hypothetical protein